jgi:GAF domain-containing protein
LEPEALIGKTILDIGLPEETAKILLAEDEALMRSEESLIVSEEEILLDGATRYQTITKVLLRDASGQVQSMVGFAHDVTKQVEATEAQKKLQQELEEQLERVNALQRAMTRESWQAFMTTTAGKRPFQGFEFNQAGIKTLTTQDLTNSKNKEMGSSAPNDNNEVITPVKIHDTTIGKIGVRNSDGTPISEEKRSLLISLTAQVAEALDRARLFEETELGRQEIEGQAAELSTVNEISELVSTQLNINDLVKAVGDRLIQTFSASSVYIALVDEKTKTINFPYFVHKTDGPLKVSPRTIDEGGGFTAQIYKTRQPIIHNHADDDPEASITANGGETVDSSELSDSYIGVPMIVGDKVIGVIGLNSQQELRMYDQDDIPLLTTLASTIAVALQNAQQFEATQRRANREALVNEINQKIQNAPTIESAMQTAVTELGKALNLKRAVVKLNKPDSNGK